MKALKIVSAVCLAVCLFLAMTTIVLAQTGTNWSKPVTAVTGDGEHWLGHPSILGGKGHLWLAHEAYPTMVVAHSVDGQSWEALEEWGWDFGVFVSVQTLTATINHHGEEVLESIVGVLHYDDGEPQDLYVNGTVEIGGGRLDSTCLQPFRSSGRHRGFKTEDTYHIVWRNFPNNEVLYGRGEQYDHWYYDKVTRWWRFPITITSELTQGTAPAIWANTERIVVLADQMYNGGYPKSQTWAFVSLDGGKTWEKSFVGEGYSPKIMESSGNLVVVLNEDEGTALRSYLSQDGGKSWTGPYPIPTDHPEEHAVAQLSNGMLALVWTDDQQIWATFNSDGRNWLAPEVVYGSEGTNTHPGVTFWKDRVYIAWYSSGPDQPERILVSNRPAPSIHRIYLPVILADGG